MQSDSAVMRMPHRFSRFWRSLLHRDSAPEAVEPVAEPQQEIPTRVIEPVDIPNNDPLLAYLQSASGVVELDKILLDSPAIREMRAGDVTLIVPLVSQGELVGLINLGPRLSEQEYSSDDRQLLENLASQAAPSLQVARMVSQQQAELQERERINHQLRLARTIQQTLLPKNIPEIPGWKLDAYYQPAWEVGGDFYDFIAFEDGNLGVIIGDVTDKGVPSALVMATTRSLLRASAERLIMPGAVLERVNNLLQDEIPANMFVTCFYLILNPETGEVQYANAGHDLPYLARAETTEELKATGMPLGLMPGMSYEERQTIIGEGDHLLLHSDGLAEAHNPERQMFGFARVRDSVLARRSGCSMIESLLEELGEFTGAGWIQEDDVTMVTLERDYPEAKQPDEFQELADFEIACVPGNEREAIAEIVDAVSGLDIPDSQLERIKTAVGEATMNAMEHGNNYQEDQPVRITATASPDQLRIAIVDNGDNAFTSPDEPDLEAKLAGEQSPRGWGLFLIGHMVDELNLEPSEDQHLTELVFYLKEDDHGS